MRRAPGRPLPRRDARPAEIDWFRSTLRRILELRGKPRLLAKYPRLPLRLGWLDRVFPGCLFLHLVRDWRAVVHSTVGRKEVREGDEGKGGWFGVRIPGWKAMREQKIPHELAAGRQYRFVQGYLEREGPRYGNRYFRITYENLCDKTAETLRSVVVDRCGMAWSDEFEKSLPPKLESRNFKWKTGLAPEMIEQIRSEDRDFFPRYEF